VADAEIRKPKRGRAMFRDRPKPAYESRPPDDESIRSVQREHRPWGEKSVDDEDEEED
jgi:hypothetical protein